MTFKEESHLHNIKVQHEAASADVEAAASYLEDLCKITNEGGYTKQQISNVDGTALYWKKTPSSTLIAGQEKSMPGFKSSVDRLTVLLGANAAGDLKLKPMLTYHDENPGALKNYKPTLPHICLQHGLLNILNPLLRSAAQKKKIPFKISLLTDSIPGHSRTLTGRYNEINVVFMPAHHHIHSAAMDQGVLSSLSSFKSYYLRSTFHKATATRDQDSFWKSPWKGFTILHAVKNIHDSWEEVKISTLAGT
ncbi:unnamed protein product [Nyctereutes procyonoides]|uniref:(raccoon dog) hypothetical protein n=1 Tax=Nyctereutes procyonoides TaxID=34880 RepID=A0A811Y5G6_NYCPR|nr:unnamed protein product [Nyctereutes procyonoides]